MGIRNLDKFFDHLINMPANEGSADQRYIRAPRCSGHRLIRHTASASADSFFLSRAVSVTVDVGRLVSLLIRQRL